MDQIWTTAAQLTTTDYNRRQLIKLGVIVGNVTQAVVVDCLRGTHNPSVPGSSPGGPTIFFNDLGRMTHSLGRRTQT